MMKITIPAAELLELMTQYRNLEKKIWDILEQLRIEWGLSKWSEAVSICRNFVTSSASDLPEVLVSPAKKRFTSLLKEHKLKAQEIKAREEQALEYTSTEDTRFNLSMHIVGSHPCEGPNCKKTTVIRLMDYIEWRDEQLRIASYLCPECMEELVDED